MRTELQSQDVVNAFNQKEDCSPNDRRKSQNMMLFSVLYIPLNASILAPANGEKFMFYRLGLIHRFLLITHLTKYTNFAMCIVGLTLGVPVYTVSSKQYMLSVALYCRCEFVISAR